MSLFHVSNSKKFILLFYSSLYLPLSWVFYEPTLQRSGLEPQQAWIFHCDDLLWIHFLILQFQCEIHYNSGVEECAQGRREGRGTLTSKARWGEVGGKHQDIVGTKNHSSQGYHWKVRARIFPRILSQGNRRKIWPKEIPSCLIPHLLNFTRQLEILVTSLYFPDAKQFTGNTASCFLFTNMQNNNNNNNKSYQIEQSPFPG